MLTLPVILPAQFKGQAALGTGQMAEMFNSHEVKNQRRWTAFLRRADREVKPNRQSPDSRLP
jgi:hypothetical protein